MMRFQEVLLLSVMLPLIQGQVEDPQGSSIWSNPPFRSEIRLKAGLLDAPPFAYVEDGKPVTNKGLHLDILESMKIFASQENINLQVDLGVLPPFYSEAIDILASDCNTTANPYPLEECQAFDIILGDFWSNLDRFKRVDFTPPWLHTSMGTLTYVDKKEGALDIKTLKEAGAAKLPVCSSHSTYVHELIKEYIPGTVVMPCDKDVCIERVKNGTCALYTGDVLKMEHWAKTDPELRATREQFRFQFLVWPMKKAPALDPVVSHRIAKWMYAVFSNGTLDELYAKYFTEESCPIGTAGVNCDLPCDPEHGTADTSGICICDSTKWTGDDCSVMVEEERNKLPPKMVQTCYSLVGITFVIVAICAVWVIRNRERAQVKIVQPTFLLLILLGCLISTSTIIALAQEDKGDGACMAIPWLYSVGFSITFGSLFTRIRRVYLLMQSACAMRRVSLSTRETIMTVGLVLALDVAVLLIWTIVDPLTWSRAIISSDKFGEPLESVGSCGSDHWDIFLGVIASLHLLLMGRACYMCYLARSIPDRFSKSKFVSIAMFSNLQILIVGIPVLIIVDSDPVARFFITSVGIWINDFAVVCLIFGNLIYEVNMFDRQQAKMPSLSRLASVAKIQSDILDYSQRHGSSHTRASLDNSNHSCASFTSSFPSLRMTQLVGKKLEFKLGTPKQLKTKILKKTKRKPSEVCPEEISPPGEETIAQSEEHQESPMAVVSGPKMTTVRDEDNLIGGSSCSDQDNDILEEVQKIHQRIALGAPPSSFPPSN